MKSINKNFDGQLSVNKCEGKLVQKYFQSLIKCIVVGLGGFLIISSLLEGKWIEALTFAMGTLIGVISTNTPRIQGRKQMQIPEKYKKLANYLATGQWKKADKETTELLMKQEQSSLYDVVSFDYLGDSFTINELYDMPYQRICEYCASIPCENIQIIDLLWGHFSDGRFGLSAQRKVAWENKIQDMKDMEKLGELLGWRDNGYWIYYEDLTFDMKAPLGHLPVDWLIGSSCLIEHQVLYL